ncbi:MULTISPECIES: hypothetical protein [unclassified Rhodococcus (in: high G+C Gram-positive bacteria)]|nr:MULTISPECIES: hypothetical protein [unclassified Rhodococcus (in: high G+C Gram-positive bacteria)]
MHAVDGVDHARRIEDGVVHTRLQVGRPGERLSRIEREQILDV